MTIGTYFARAKRRLRRVSPRQWLMLAMILFLCGALLLVLIRLPVRETVEAIRDMGTIPFFLAMAVLPVVGFPVSPFYLLAGATFGITISLLGTAAAQAINLLLAYWLARRFLRQIVERVVIRAGYTIPRVKPRNYVNFSILIKVTPGLPNFLKTFILALAEIPFGIFFIVSWPSTMGFAVGLIIFGDSLMDRNPGQALVGLALMLAFLLLIKYLATIYSRKRGHEDAE